MGAARQAIALVAVLALGLASCGTGEEKDAGARATPLTATAAVDPATTASFGDREQSRLEYAGADGMVAADGALWVKTDVGHVLRIDPRSDRVTADVVVDKHTGQSFYCQGIGAVAGAVWSCATRAGGTEVVRIDPDAARITRLVPVGKVFDQLALPSAGQTIGVLVDDGTALSVVDPSGAVRTFPLGGRYQQLAGSGDTFVATSTVEDGAVVVDAGSGTVRERLQVVDARMAAVVGGDVWVDCFDGLTHFSDGLSRRTVYPGLVAGPGGDVFSDGGSVWVRSSEGTITQVDAASGEVLQQVAPATPLSGGSLVVAYGSIWTTGSDEGVIIRLRRR
jgi:streptogramin lyase